MGVGGGVWLINGTPRSPYLSPAAGLASSRPPPLLLLFFSSAETLMDSRWATTELAWTTFPESGVSVCVCVCVCVRARAPSLFLFHLPVNKAQSACYSMPPTV